MGVVAQRSFLLAGALCLAIPIGLAPAQVPQSKIHLFRGGHLELTSRLHLATRADCGYILSNGQVLPSLSADQNPAFLHLVNRPQVRLRTLVPYSIDAATFVDLTGEASRGVLDATSSYRASDAEISGPRVQARIGLAEFLEGFQLVVPAGGFRLAFGYENTLAGNLRATIVGSRTRVSTLVESAGTTTPVVLNALLDAESDLAVRVRNTHLVASTRIARRTIFGLQLTRQTLELRLRGQVRADATMLYAGLEHAFNDPSAPWPTDLSQELDVDIRGAGISLRAGVWHLLTKSTVVDASIRVAGATECKGKVFLVQNRIPALNLDGLLLGEEDAEILEPARLKLTQLTLTERVQPKTYGGARLTSPVELRLGFLSVARRASGAFAAQAYVGELGFQYGPTLLAARPRWKLHGTLSYGRAFTTLSLTSLELFTQGAGRYVRDIRQGLGAPQWAFGLAWQRGPWTVVQYLRLLPVPNLALTLTLIF
ncbi:MAG: hypothetical protein ONB23_08025 [candidate division KSB1 bacterium]|nr:hypothetical protein [candidate division KSB1 bacterium]